MRGEPTSVPTNDVSCCNAGGIEPEKNCGMSLGAGGAGAPFGAAPGTMGLDSTGSQLPGRFSSLIKFELSGIFPLFYDVASEDGHAVHFIAIRSVAEINLNLHVAALCERCVRREVITVRAVRCRNNRLAVQRWRVESRDTTSHIRTIYKRCERAADF